MSSVAPEQSTLQSDMELTEKFKDIIRSNGIEDIVSEITVKDAGRKGEGFISLTQSVTIKFENPTVKDIHLFVKRHTSNCSHTEMIMEMKAFEKEASFLMDYVPAAKEMCKAKGRGDLVDFYPNCYFGDEELIVLEDLVLDKGYEMTNKTALQDLETARISITTLAKHHAVSHAMIQEIGGEDKFFQRFPIFKYECFDKPAIVAMMEPSYDNTINSDLKILKTSSVPGRTETAEKLRSYLGGKPHRITMKAIRDVDSKDFLVLNHGDFWNSNMMFLKDKETGKIVHNMALDFQIVRYNTPGLDIGYYMFLSLQPSVRRDHLHELLKIYTEALNSTAEDLGWPLNLTFEQILLDFRKKINFGFWMSIAVAVGPGMSIFDEMDINEIDMKEWVQIFDKMTNKWIEANPDKTNKVAEDLVELFKEYEGLLLTNDG